MATDMIDVNPAGQEVQPLWHDARPHHPQEGRSAPQSEFLSAMQEAWWPQRDFPKWGAIYSAASRWRFLPMLP